MEKGSVVIINAKELVTCSGFKGKAGAEMSELHIIEDGALIINQGVISKVGRTHEILEQLDPNINYQIIDASDKCVMPGFVDSHTHFVFGGYRAEEFSWRLRGDSYMDIMQRGGGIVNSVKATRECSYGQLLDIAKKRLDSMMAYGITTVEGKSGYGLDKETELKQLRVMKELQNTHPMDIATTFMGAHAIPPEYKGKADDFVDVVIDMMQDVSRESLAEFCDVFCEKNVFSIEQSEKILNRAREHGMKIKLHADEIVQLGGAELAARLGAQSADHLLQASDKGIEEMARAGVTSTLLPATAFSLREHYARARHMIDKGCIVALATDFNPGSCFTYSIPLVIALACLYMSMTPEEAVTALTINGAAALGRADSIGSLDPGKKGDVIILKHPSYKFLPYHVGVNIVETVIKEGVVIQAHN